MQVILTELVDGVQAGYFFGPGSPHNIGKDLTALTAACPGIYESDVVTEAFRIAATIHAAYWRDRALLDDPRFATLRCREWSRGGGRESWEAGLSFARGLWEKAKPVSEALVVLHKSNDACPTVHTRVMRCRLCILPLLSRPV